MIQRSHLIIVGGSFAALACARTAALRGLNVAVVDGKSEPSRMCAPPASSSRKQATVSICQRVV